MGYSTRYHAISIAAIFLALGIGILIGVGFGDTVVSGARDDLQSSLREDLSASRRDRDQALEEADRERQFSRAAYPALARNRLQGDRVGVLGIGDLDDQITTDIEDTLEPTDGRLGEVVVLRAPPDLDALADRLAGTPYADIARDPDVQQSFGKRIGSELVHGGSLLRRTRKQLFSRISGRVSPADAFLITRSLPSTLDADAQDDTDTLSAAIVQGIAAERVPTVGVDRSDADPSSVPWLQDRGLTTVDNIDQYSGRLSTVLALEGAEGNFGTGPTADRLTPDIVSGAGENGSGQGG